MAGTKAPMQEHAWHVQVSTRGQWGYSEVGGEGKKVTASRSESLGTIVGLSM